ncbi:MAG: adenosine deaminase [Elusimicrobia bacterium]|nr:adenosine deaminase [Elusimicrobiota bacterium]
MKTLELLKRIPKVDIHCHLDGSVRTATIIDAARKHNFKLPTEDPQQLNKYVQVSPTCKSLTDFLKRFEFFYDFLKFPDVVERISYELCEDVSKENIKYLEVRFAPFLQSSDRFSIEDVIRTAISGLMQGARDFHIGVGAIVCIYRSLPDDINRLTVSLAEKYFGKGVAGIDLAGDETKYPAERYAEFFEYARKRRIPITCHAGEAAGAESIRKALELGARRIGHGVHLAEDEGLYKKVMDEGIPIEMCLTSNVQTQVVKSYKTHPFLKFYEDGLKVTLNTDDRSVSGIDLTHEYLVAVEQYGLKISDIIKIILNGINSLFLPESEIDNIKKCMSDIIERMLLEERSGRTGGTTTGGKNDFQRNRIPEHY